jgi:hypothetical protein
VSTTPPGDTPTMRDLLQAQVDVILHALQTIALPVGQTFESWYEDGCDLQVFPGDRSEMAYALGYLRGAHELADVTLLELLEEHEVDTLYICADCERSTAPWHTDEISHHECS